MSNKTLHHPLYEEIGKELDLGELFNIELIQSLWSGYGELVRLKFRKSSVIVKHVKLPDTLEHPRGWNNQFSHKRKLHSYEKEVNWYKLFSQVQDERCLIPVGLKCFKSETEWLIVMEDLLNIGLGNTTKKATKNHLRSALSWLANFHAKFMGTKSEKVWKIGTYWHLDTRPDELEVLEDNHLKNYAKEIDRKLNSATYQTFVHGDAKLANFCFNEDGTKCAAVDFQYVGHGCGMKDVVLFMSSSIDPNDCESMEKWVLDFYFRELKSAVEYYHPKIDTKAVEKEWRPMFYVAWADFQRFIKGWSPNHYKINLYTENLTKNLLNSLK